APFRRDRASRRGWGRETDWTWASNASRGARGPDPWGAQPLRVLLFQSRLPTWGTSLMESSHGRPFRFSDHGALARRPSRAVAALFAEHAQWREGVDHAG